MATLVITISGPFAYVDSTFNGTPAPGFLTLMAPMCPQHAAGMAGIEAKNQYVLPRDKVNCRNHKAGCADCDSHRFQLDVGLSAPTNTAPWNSTLLLRPTVAGKQFDPKQWRFWLTLPRPDIFVEIQPVQAVLIQPGGGSAINSYAIGVRLIYNNWDGNSIRLLHEGSPAPDPNGHPFAFQFAQGTSLAILEIDYSSPVRDDPDHEDAVDCFENLMSALGLPWSIYIPPMVPLGHLDAGKLNDCKAAIAWID